MSAGQRLLGFVEMVECWVTSEIKTPLSSWESLILSPGSKQSGRIDLHRGYLLPSSKQKYEPFSSLHSQAATFPLLIFSRKDVWGFFTIESENVRGWKGH